MNPFLALALIQKGAIKEGTEIEGYYKGIDLSGSAIARVPGIFSVREAKQTKDGEIFFICRDTRDGAKRKIICPDVSLIDGMEPERAASVYGFMMEGDTVVALKKRGRKAKDEQVDDDDLGDEPGAELEAA